jgi:hypothetical protein
MRRLERASDWALAIIGQWSLPHSIRPPLQSRQMELEGTRVTLISLNAVSSLTCSGEITSRSHLT